MTIQYFMDEMQDYEVNDIIENIPSLDRNQWEMTRLLLYQTIQMNSKKKYQLSDILKFKWDREIKIEDKEISDDDIQRLKNKAKSIKELYGKQPDNESDC